MTETKDRTDPPHSAKTAPGGRAPAPILKLILELGPLMLFFFANAKPKLFAPLVELVLPPQLMTGENAGLFTATAVLIPAVLIALVISYWRTRNLPIMPLMTAVLVLIFGSLTLYLQNPSFIKMKPTILYTAFGLTLLGGLYFDKPLLPVILDHAIELTERGWWILTRRWAIFFFALAITNEAVWRLNEIYLPSRPNDVWVYFKFPCTMIIIFLFTMAQLPLMQRYEVKREAAAE